MLGTTSSRIAIKETQNTRNLNWIGTSSLIPQMNIGRIPAKTLDEFQSYMVKHKNYVLKGFDDWNKRYLFFAGGNFTDPNQIAQCKGVNDFIINNYVIPPPIGGVIANFYKTADPISNFGPYPQEYINNAINQGGVFISYIGHSGTQTWDNSITEISQIANIRDRNPLITDFGCSTAKFAEPDVLSFSELAVSNLQGQAIGYIGNSSIGFTSTAYSFPQVFYKTLLVDTSASIGDVHRLSKIAYIKQFGTSDIYGLFIKTNSLVGDPIVRLPIPTKPNITFSNSVISMSPERPTDQSDSLQLKVPYYNLGKVIQDSVEFAVSIQFKGSGFLSFILKRKIPLYVDSLVISIPIKNQPGEYSVTIQADPSNKLDEIYKNDNSIVYRPQVASSSIRTLTLSPYTNQINSSVIFLNPTDIPSQPSFFVDISLNDQFDPKTTYQIPYDTFATAFTIDTSYNAKRIWLRSKLNAQATEGLAYSYRVGKTENYFFGDSLAFQQIAKTYTKYSSNKLALDTSETIFSAISGGFNDGNTAVISKNGQNYVPENTLRGFHVCIYDARTYDFKWYYRFDVQAGSSISTNFKTLLDTLSAGYLVIISIANDVASSGTLFPSTLKTAIKNYGSKLIDSVRVADSWALIGKKGALPGTMPEGYGKRYNGRAVLIDTTIIIPNTDGMFSTEEIGPVAEWKNIGLQYSQNNPGDISLKVVGVSAAHSLDTLRQWSVVDSVLDISTINAKQYPSIKILGEMQRGAGESSPELSSLEVNYAGLPELGTNYQTVLAAREKEGTPILANDSVLQGEKINLSVKVYNAGGSMAKNVGVQMQSVWENGVIEPVLTASIDSINPLSYHVMMATYNTAMGYGKRNLRISIDPEAAIQELYKDNNIFVYPIVVKKSESSVLLPNLSITQNGIQLLASSITNRQDSVPVRIVYGNSGALVNDSITVSIKQYYLGNSIASWILRRKYPLSFDTLYVSVPVLNKAGEHQIQVELDPFGLLTESTKSDNVLNYYFTVKTTDFTIMQPTEFSTSYFSEIIFLNPTTAQGSVERNADFQIDSAADFSTSVPLLLPMNEFTTSSALGLLKHPHRYYWRIRQQNSGNAWTTGSFYLGDSPGFTFGQSDSVGWSRNMFTHAGFLSSGGAQIVDTKYAIRATSSDSTGSIEVNGTNLIAPIFGEGHNVLVLDTNSYSLLSQRRFDISNTPDESDSLTMYITNLSTGVVVVDVLIGDGSNNLKQTTRDALKTIGSSQIDKVSFKDSWAIIGRKGAAIGSVPEQYKPQSTGPAIADTVIIKKETSAAIVTPSFGPLTSPSQLSMITNVPSGTSLQADLVGTKDGKTDTTSLGAFSPARLSSAKNVRYDTAYIIFSLHTSNQSTPSIESWKLSSMQATELAVSSGSTSLDRGEVLEGEPIRFSGTVYNVSGIQADSVTAALFTTEGGTEKILKSASFTSVPSHDSAMFSYTYDTRGKRGSYAFIFKIDPADSILEQTKENNRITIPYHVIADTIPPHVDITFDGVHIYDGDYTLSSPTIAINVSDNSLLSFLEPSDVSVKIDERKISLGAFPDSLFETKTGLEKALVIVKPTLERGSHTLTLQVQDAAGNFADTVAKEIHFRVETDAKLLDVFNYPNPFGSETYFTFNITGSKLPEEAVIKVYTIAGRMIQEIRLPQGILFPGFNRIRWDGKDRDGDELANGIYLYKVLMTSEGKSIEVIQKLAKVR